jgi:desulfoferrodoxin (superoxide reductase-like protein)
MKSRIFKTLICLATILGIILLSSQAYANPPQDIKLGYDTVDSTLDVTITHEIPTTVPPVHYIYKVDVEKNGELYLSEEYTSQPSTETFTYTYEVETAEGDEVKAIAFCNLFGSLSASVIIPSKDAPSTPDISGNRNIKPNTDYDYNFVARDPNNDDLLYYIDWGDGTNSGWIGPFASGEEIVRTHSWSSNGEFALTVKAKDINDNEGLPGTLDITVPRTREYQFNLLIQLAQRFFDRFTFLAKIFF